ncbi:putative F420-dependent oxidoreductase family protein [Mycobacterium tuberculosis variant bovis BCG str. ATCC 35743]|nr:putative F420-dependent oxidoreductase family protein [Mycobacterium tuberculosis variant bovis BCG str. ATCC 35743]
MLVSLMQFVTDLTPPPQLVAVWAEERGFAGLYVPEKTHVPISRSTPWPGGELPDWYRRCYDPVVALAAAAAVTTRLRVGTGACLVAVHDPILLAKQIASLCAMSGERFVLGVGFGWNVEELADHGVPFADRIAVTVDKLAAMRAMPERSCLMKAAADARLAHAVRHRPDPTPAVGRGVGRGARLRGPVCAGEDARADQQEHAVARWRAAGLVSPLL